MSLNTILATAPLTATGYHLKATGTALGQSLIWDNGTNVGIGNTNTSYTLDVSGTVRGTTSAYFATASGSVGIGTVSPSDKFSVDAGAGNVVTSSFFNSTMTAGQSSYIEIGKNYSSTYNTGELAFKYVGDGSSSNIVSLGFYGAGNKLNVLGNGNVGIGTSSPNAKLNVVNDDGVGSGLHIIADFNRNTSSAELILGYYADGTNVTTNAVYSANSLPLAFYTGATERMRISSAGWSKFSNTGTYSSPNGTFHQFNSDDVDDVTLQVYASSTSKTGNVLESVCARAGSGNYNLIAAYAVSTLQFVVRGDGLLILPSLVSTFTTANAANMWVNPADGAVSRSTSSIKYKKNVEDYNKGLDIVMQLRPVSYEGKSKIDEGKIFAGFIAEEIHDIGLTEYVQYAEDGTPDALAYANMIALLTKAIQEQQIQIQNLQEQINILAK